MSTPDPTDDGPTCLIPVSLEDRVAEAHRILDDAIAGIADDSKELVGIVTLYSGGNDSTILAHLMRHRATHHAHANTTIGIEATRQFVRDTSAAWGIPLLEFTGEHSYRDLVIERGFPGPGMHWKMYQRLKERALRQVRRELVSNGRRQRVIFLAGRRRDESQRRSSVPMSEREGSVVWVSPLVNWTRTDMRAYRAANPDVPLNEVSDLIHMSGECLCGAFATEGEKEQIRMFFPDVAAELDQLEADVRAAGHSEPKCVWGWGGYPQWAKVEVASKTGKLCDCQQLALFADETRDAAA